MSEECPNCGQLTNASFSRLVKDSCGHTKCRMCLLYEENGCKTCQIKCKQDVQDYKETTKIISKTSTEEIVLPLELVIHKELKESKESKENCYDSISIKRSSTHIYSKNVTYDTDESLSKFAINNDDRTMPKIDEQVMKNNKSTKCRDRSHITLVPGTLEKYKCNVCTKTFRNKKGKCYHDACVTGIKPYQCTFCDRSFVKRSHFEYHERVHSGYKPYKCNLCEKAFPQQNKLNRHMSSHSKEKRFECPECSKRYSKRSDLKNHLNIHNATNTYTCKYCDKSFHVLTNLKRHMRTHTNERPHVCDQCKKSFKDRSLLIRHKRIHEKERPFSCAHCNRVFLSKNELRRHLTVHSGEKPFSCAYCQTFFRRKDNLNRHIRHHHSENCNNFEANQTNEEQVDRDTSKDYQQRQRQKLKKVQSKSPNKVPVAFANSYDQINSRLDSMGNITPVIRTTSEVSNAVPVINGPINIKRLEDRTDKRVFTYTEPIPIAEAVVINCRIEEKLYPQSASSHNYFVRSYLRNRNSKVNSYPGNNKIILQETSSSDMPTSSQFRLSPPRTTADQKTATADIDEIRSTIRKRDKNDRGKDVGGKRDRETDDGYREVFHDEYNCVSTIKRHIARQFEEHITKNATSDDAEVTKCATDSSIEQPPSCKRKESDVHWRRRTAETLAPCNR